MSANDPMRTLAGAQRPVPEISSRPFQSAAQNRSTCRFGSQTKFELTINLKTAKTLGLTISREFRLSPTR
jgi:hypothetical protein